jgi:dephospho-CoA kinase
MEPGGASYDVLVEEFGKGILEDENQENSPISRPKLAKVAMATEESRLRLNELTHPLVQQAVEAELKRLAEDGFRGVAVIEAALLIEAGYKSICDSLWYVHAPLEHRIRRMKEKRGYSDEKIAGILAGQLSEAEFKANADVVIENPDGDKVIILEGLQQQIRVLLKDYVESTDKM